MVESNLSEARETRFDILYRNMSSLMNDFVDKQGEGSDPNLAKTCTLVAMIGETTNESVSSVKNSGYKNIINIVDENTKRVYGVDSVVCDDNLKFLNLAFSYAKDNRYKYVYFMYGRSILNHKMIANLDLKDFHENACHYSNYAYIGLDDKAAEENKCSVKNLTSFDPILFKKSIIPVINLFVYIKSVKKFDYTTPYDFVVGEYDSGNIVNHVPETLFFTPEDPYENLNKDILNKYAKLYI
jgi:hypothetical protein